jgi:hypothetical protein
LPPRATASPGAAPSPQRQNARTRNPPRPAPVLLPTALLPTGGARPHEDTLGPPHMEDTRHRHAPEGPPRSLQTPSSPL